MSDENTNFDATYARYMREEKIGADCAISFRIPLPNPQGSVNFPGETGKLMHVFDDGLALRGANGETIYAFRDLQMITFPSSIKLAS